MFLFFQGKSALKNKENTSNNKNNKNKLTIGWLLQNKGACEKDIKISWITRNFFNIN